MHIFDLISLIFPYQKTTVVKISHINKTHKWQGSEWRVKRTNMFWQIPHDRSKQLHLIKHTNDQASQWRVKKANTTAERVKKAYPAYSLVALKMNDIDKMKVNSWKIHWLSTNKNPSFLYRCNYTWNVKYSSKNVILWNNYLESTPLNLIF